MQNGHELLKTAVTRVTKEWVPIYAKRDDAEHMIKSLLLGVEHNLRWRMGQMSKDDKAPLGINVQAFWVGYDCAVKIPESILRRVDRP